MDYTKCLNDYYQKNKSVLLTYDQVLNKMSKFSFSDFYLYRKLLPNYINEENFLFGFEFGVCILKDKLLYLGEKLWIHEDFQFLDKFEIIIDKGMIKRDSNKKVSINSDLLEIFKDLIENVVPNFKNLESQFEIEKNDKLNLIKESKISELDMKVNVKLIEEKYKVKKSKIDISEIISDWYTNYSNNYKTILVSKDYIIQQNKKIFSGKFWKSDVIKETIEYDFYPEIKFGTNTGIVIRGSVVYFIDNDNSSYINFDLDDLKEESYKNVLKNNLIKIEDGYIKKFYDLIRFSEGGMGLGRRRISREEINLIDDIVQFIIEHIRIYNKIILDRKKVDYEIKNKQELERIDNLNKKKNNILLELDKDGNGEIDLIDSESFNKLISLHQKYIIEIDKNYIQKFVKISLYIKNKKSNIRSLFKSITRTKNEEDLNESLNLIKNQIHTYDLLIFHSINMVTSIIESDLITFYEIYECFDQLGVFNSNWENEVSNKLTNIGNDLKELMYSIYQMENKIVTSISNLTYVTRDSFKELNMSVNNQLKSIDSSIKFNNLLTGIQTYQMYKINQNTKKIN